MNIKERINALRSWMEQHQVDAYIVPSSDPHNSEYLAEHWKLREWISGFTGSAGTIVITHNHAGLWTDSRYFIQAREELKEGGLVLHKLVNQGEPEWLTWLCEEQLGGAKVGIDDAHFTVHEIRAMESVFAPEKIELRFLPDPFREIWQDRPALPQEKIFEVDAAFTGATREERIGQLSDELSSRGCDSMLITALDEIAWLLNLRGRDVECNPVFIAFAVLQARQLHLFVGDGKIDAALQKKLEGDRISMHPYSEIRRFLENLSTEGTLLLDIQKTSKQLFDALSHTKLLEAPSPITRMKAIKNETEIAHLRRVMVKDGVALVKAFRWLERALDANETPTEAEFSDKIAEFRSREAHYFGESFHAIVGFKGNGAIVHYRPEHGKAAKIEQGGMLLVDSGGQYTDGTTDITRTIHTGTPSAEEKKYFTLVLKGHIALAKAKFPAGTRGIQLDVLARQFLWQDLANYGHGTGHGVGFFMNVHEPPQGFVSGLNERGTTVHLPGMYSSNEPGFYKENAFGIRIENLILCREAGTNEYGSFLEHETITLFPIEHKLIDASLLEEAERQWLKDYHQRVWEALSPHLNEEENKWLEEKCAVGF